MSLAFLSWSKATAIPDEMVVPTLARISTMREENNTWVVEQGYVPQPSPTELSWVAAMQGDMEELCVCVLLVIPGHYPAVRLLSGQQVQE